MASELNLGDVLQHIIDHTQGEDEGEEGGSGSSRSITVSQLIDAKDRVGQRPLHKCAMRDNEDAAIILLTAGAVTTVSTLMGITPMHTAAMYGSSKVWLTLLEAGVDMNTLVDCWQKTPADVAKAHGYTIDNKLGLVFGDCTDAANSVQNVPSTVIISHDMCMKHHTCPPSELAQNPSSAPPENNKRLTVLIDEEKGILRSSDLSAHLTWEMNPRAASLSDIMRVHEWSYVRSIQSKCEVLSKNPEAVQGMGSLDADTAISWHSYSAALYGAGATCRGVDRIMDGSARNAFCPVRPPGHHAGPNGVVTRGGSGNYESGASDSHGFCLFNNISIAASYAMNMYRDTIRKVAFVDFDVHHGNGTEETVRWLRPGVQTLDVSSSFCYGVVQAPRFKPWYDANDPDNVLFISVHGFGPRERIDPTEHLMFPVGAFYPGTGKTIVPEVSGPETSDASTMRMETNSNDNAATMNVVNSEMNRETAPIRENTAAMDNNNDNNNSGGHDNDDGEDEDDEDYKYEEDEGSWGSGSDDDNASRASNGDNVMKKVNKLRRLYSSQFTGDGSGSSGSTKLNPLQPLILDIGVQLPAEDTEEVNMSASGLYRHQWRNYFRDEIFPRLMEFKPDIIFISAGFDAHKKDTINAGYIALVSEVVQVHIELLSSFFCIV